MANEHEALVADVALAFCGGDARKAARIIAFIAERTKEATRSQLDAYWGGPENCQPRELADKLAAAAWRDQHAASALWPPAFTDAGPADGGQ